MATKTQYLHSQISLISFFSNLFSIHKLENLLATKRNGELSYNCIFILGCTKDILIFSTAQNSGYKYHIKLSNYDKNSLDKILNFLEKYTWTIQKNKEIKSTHSNNIQTKIDSIPLRENLKTFTNDIDIKIGETPPDFIPFLKTIHIQNSKTTYI